MQFVVIAYDGTDEKALERPIGDGACKYVFSTIERNRIAEILRNCDLPKIDSGS